MSFVFRSPTIVIAGDLKSVGRFLSTHMTANLSVNLQALKVVHMTRNNSLLPLTPKLSLNL